MKKLLSKDATTLPREKLVSRGTRALSDQELVAIILGSGCKGVPVQKLASRVIEALDNKVGKLIISSLIGDLI